MKIKKDKKKKAVGRTKLAGPVELKSENAFYAPSVPLDENERFELDSYRRQNAWKALSDGENNFRLALKELGADVEQSHAMLNAAESLIGAFLAVRALD